PVYGSVQPARNKHSPGPAKRDGCRIYDIAGNIFDSSIRGEPENRNRHSFTPRTGTRHIQRAITWIEARVRNRVKTTGQLPADYEVHRCTGAASTRQKSNSNFAFGGKIRNRNQRVTMSRSGNVSGLAGEQKGYCARSLARNPGVSDSHLATANSRSGIDSGYPWSFTH